MYLLSTSYILTRKFKQNSFYPLEFFLVTESTDKGQSMINVFGVWYLITLS